MFVFNCYRHIAILILRCQNREYIFLLLKEGVTQGNLLCMVLYKLTLATIAEFLGEVVPELVQL